MAVEDLVVDDEHVGECVDVVAVSRDDRRATLRGPPLDLARPVHLHHIRDDDQHRVGVRDAGGEHRLRSLSEARLVGEQESTVPGTHGLEEPRLVVHDLEAARRKPIELGQLRELHRRGPAAGALSERLVERPHQLPAVELPTRLGRRCEPGRLRGEERVRVDPGLDLRGPHGPLRCHGRHDRRRDLRLRIVDDEVLGWQFDSRVEQPVAAHALRDGTRGLVDFEQLDQRGVACRRLREDRRDAVESLEQLCARRIGELVVFLDACALFAHEEGDDLELHAVGRPQLVLLRLRLNLTHLAREDRDDRCHVVASCGRGLLALSRGCRGRHAPPEPNSRCRQRRTGREVVHRRLRL